MEGRSANEGLEMGYVKKRPWPNLTYQLQMFLGPFTAQQLVCITERDLTIAAEQDTKQSSRVTEIFN
jgi:hypothetical protein